MNWQENQNYFIHITHCRKKIDVKSAFLTKVKSMNFVQQYGHFQILFYKLMQFWEIFDELGEFMLYGTQGLSQMLYRVCSPKPTGFSRFREM